MKGEIQAALVRIPSKDFKTGIQDLLAVLGYRSKRTLVEQTGDVADFIAQFPAPKPNTKTEQAFHEHVSSVRLVFQVTSIKRRDSSYRRGRQRRADTATGHSRPARFQVVA